MKKAILGALFAGAMLASCSSDEPVVGPDNGNLEGEPQFLSISLVSTSTSASGTRATGDPNNATYEDGSDVENEVNSVRFYFFKQNGEPAMVKKSGESKVNYVNWDGPFSNEGQATPNVEKILNATIVIDKPKGDDTDPYYIVAVINPVEDAANYSLGTAGTGNTDIYTVTGNYMAKVSNNFVMTNSTYAENSSKVMAVTVADHLAETKGAALDNPVKIYVERTVAKIRMDCSGLTATTLSDGTKIYKAGTESNPQTYGTGDNEKDIYVKFLGWNATMVADKSNLVKNINPAWSATLFGESNPWNWDAYHRSFWAANPSDLNYKYGTFNATDTNDPFQANAKTKFDKSECVYVNENASDNFTTGAKAGNPTKVIIAAQLVDENGESLEFAEYGGEKCEVSKLKDLYATNSGIYKKSIKDGKESYTKIEPEDIELVTATTAGEASATQAGRYKVYAQLKTTWAANTYYPTNQQGQTTALTEDQVNQSLKDLGGAKVWKDGYTYYYLDIKHIGGTILGVVRNHIYDVRVTSLAGLGTPVYDPDEVIYPEKPTPDDDAYIAAEINILSWRVVTNDYNINWN